MHTFITFDCLSVLETLVDHAHISTNYSILLYSHKLHLLLFFSMYLLFSIMLTGFTHIHIKDDNNLKVVTIRILVFFSGYILALLKAVYIVL